MHPLRGKRERFAFSPTERFESLCQGGTVNFSLFERKVTKEANERAARPPARSGFCHESPVSSARTRAVRTVLLPKAAVRFRTLRGSLGTYILPWTCASRGVPLSDLGFPQSMISSPPSKARRALCLFSYGIYADKFLFSGVTQSLPHTGEGDREVVVGATLFSPAERF